MVQQLKNVISSFSDKSAVHFAVEGVLDGLYGGERGNEIFFAYPSATIASQMKFNHDPTVPPTPNKEIGNPRNDIYVWTEGKGGLGINAGLTFIPDDAMVDAETGSLYELDKNGKPVKENIDSDKINPLSFKKTHNPISSKEYSFDFICVA